MSRISELLDEIDAFVYTGDGLFDGETRIEFKSYLQRWERGVAEVEEIIEITKKEEGNGK